MIYLALVLSVRASHRVGPLSAGRLRTSKTGRCYVGRSPSLSETTQTQPLVVDSIWLLSLTRHPGSPPTRCRGVIQGLDRGGGFSQKRPLSQRCPYFTHKNPAITLSFFPLPSVVSCASNVSIVACRNMLSQYHIGAAASLFLASYVGAQQNTNTGFQGVREEGPVDYSLHVNFRPSTPYIFVPAFACAESFAQDRKLTWRLLSAMPSSTRVWTRFRSFLQTLRIQTASRRTILLRTVASGPTA